MKPYYDEGGITIYHGDALEIVPFLGWHVLITDPPYPNNGGYFNDGIGAARCVIEDAAKQSEEVLTFWTEMERPVCRLPLVAVHVWYRTNVNGRPYEPILHYHADGQKRRSEVFRNAVPFEGATGSAYVGHPTQKPVGVMSALIRKTNSLLAPILDPFMGSGTTLVAAKSLGRSAIGIEINEAYCEIAARRLSQEVFDFGVPLVTPSSRSADVLPEGMPVGAASAQEGESVDGIPDASPSISARAAALVTPSESETP